MSLEYDVLHVLLSASDHDRFRDNLKEHQLSAPGRMILTTLDQVFRQANRPDEMTVRDVAIAGEAFNPRWSRDDLTIFMGGLEHLSKSTMVGAQSVLKTWVEREEAAIVAGGSDDYIATPMSMEGGYFQFLEERYLSLRAKLRQFEDDEDARDFEADFTSVLERLAIHGDWEWRLRALNESIGNIYPGLFVVIGGRPEAGKCLAKGTEILMHDGSTKVVEAIKEGDIVMGPDSAPRVASGITRGREPMYRIQYGTGDYYDVNESHVLSLKRSKAEGKHRNGDVLNVPVAEYITWPKGRKDRYKGWKSGVDFPHTLVEEMGHVDPYVLGVWLGDGHSAQPAFTNQDEDVWKAIQTYADGVSLCSGIEHNLKLVDTGKRCGAAVTCRLTSPYGRDNMFLNSLRTLGVYGPGKKRVPDLYKKNARDVRLEVLAGLIDADGSVTRQGYEITQKSLWLAEDILYMARSLGYHATINEKVVNGTSYWRVAMYGDFVDLPVRIGYKRIEPKATHKRQGLHFGFTVTPLGVGDYYGFAVDKDHLFMLGDFTVTHNTTFICSEASHLATQMPEDALMIFFNNESHGDVLRERFMQAAIGWKLRDIKAWPNKAQAEYDKVMGGREVLIKDIHGKNIRDVERVVDKYEDRTKLIVFDQASKVSGYENKGGNNAARLQQLAARLKAMATQVAPVITTMWADGSAEGEKWIDQNQLYDSKTGIPGEAEVIVTLGHTKQDSDKFVRYLNIPKNKSLACPNERNRHSQWQVRMLGHLARVVDP